MWAGAFGTDAYFTQVVDFVFAQLGADNTNKRNETWLLALHAVTACCIAVAAPAVMVAIPFIAAPFVASPSASQFFRHATLTCRA